MSWKKFANAWAGLASKGSILAAPPATWAGALEVESRIVGTWQKGLHDLTEVRGET